jgi:PAS domain S-box-containing protein
MFAAGSRIFSARNIKPFLPLLVYAALAVLIAAVYLSSFRQIETLIQDEKLRDLGAVADMKAAQIAEWRDNYRREGEAHTRNSLLAAEFGLWLREGAPSNERKQRLRGMLAELQHAEGYANLVLLDRRGVVRLSLVDGFALAAEDVQPVKQAADSGEVVFKDFHHDSQGEHGIRFDLMAPLTVAGEKVVGVMELEIDPYISLYPMIRSWPARSESAESLLVRRDGNDVLFLNDLRHKKATALNLRMSADAPDLPAAMAVRGVASAAAGVDYRGVPVVAEMRQVAGTPWFVVSKVDRDEMFAPVEQLKQWSASLGATLLVVGGLLVLAWLRSYQTRFNNLKAQHVAAVEREMLMRHFEYLTKYANDIILVTDDAGNLVEVNERAQQAYGYRREELLHMPVLGLCDPSREAHTFQMQVEQFNELGESRFETQNRRKDGTLFPVEVSVRAIKMEDATYFQFIIRDISERRRAEDALRRSEALLKKSQQMARIASWELDLKENILYWSDENYRIFEIDQSRFGASYEAFLATVHPDDRDRVNQAYTDSVSNKKPYSIVHRLQFPDMRVKFVQEWCETYYDETGQPLRSIGTTQDVTVQQMFQQALRKSAQRIEDLYNSAPCGYHSLDKGGVIVQINDTELQWLGYTREEVLGKINFVDLLTPGYRQFFRDNYPEFKQRGFARDLEYELVRKDGTSLFVLLNATAVYDDDGEYLMSRSSLFDITARKQAEAELRLQGTILSQMEEGVILIRADSGMIVYVNPKFEQMFGYAAGEMVGLHVSNLNAPTTRSPEEEAQAIIAALQGQGRWEGEINNRKKDGTPFWCRAVISTFEHHDYGKVWVSTHEDITERKQAEEKLNESERRFRFLAENATDMLYRMSLPDGRYEYVSPASLTMFGYAPEEFYASPALIRAIIHPAWHGYFEEQWARLIAGNMPPTYEYQIVHKRGDTRWMNQRNTLIWDESGKPLALQGIVTDVTERKLAETMLAESEERFRAMADSAPIMIWVADAESQINCHGCRYFNRRWHEFTGLPVEQAQSCAWQAIAHPDDCARLVEAYREAFLGRQPFDLEYRLRRGDGEYRWVQDSGVPRYDAEGEFIGFIGTCLDVTDHKLFDEMRAEMEHAGRLQIAGEMTSGLAHELSQPLSAANNYLSAGLLHMAESDWDKSRLLKVVSLAHAQTERAGSIINHLKDMVRKQRQERVMLDINALIRDTVHFMEYEIRQHAVSVVMDFYTLPSALASKVEIEQVLVNLIKNAVDSMASTPRRVLRITTRTIDAAFILVSVSDTGKGIVQGDLDKVFNPFQSSKQEGLGLGLPICRSLVENHGGKIWAEQHGDEGAEFNFTLPVGANDE